MKLKTVFALLMLGVLVNACSEKKENETVASTEATFSLAEAAGNLTSGCQNLNDGTVLNSTSYLRLYQLNADGTYLLTLSFYSQPNCVTGGGDHFMSFSQSGQWQTDGASSVANASNIRFVVDGDPHLTVYGATSLGHDIAGYLNAACSTTFNHSATKTLNVDSLHCVRVTSPSLNWTFPGTTGIVGTSGILSAGSSATLKIANPNIIWYPGDAGSYPSSVNLVLTYY